MQGSNTAEIGKQPWNIVQTISHKTPQNHNADKSEQQQKFHLCMRVLDTFESISQLLRSLRRQQPFAFWTATAQT